MTIKYIDTFSVYSYHQQINACLLKMIVRSFPREKVTCFSSKSNKEAILDLIPEERKSIEWRKVAVLGGHSPYALFLRYLMSAVLNVMCLLFSKRGQMLIFSNNNPFSLGAVNFCNRFLKRKIIIVCHAEMELLLPNRRHGKLATVLAKFIRSFFLAQKIDDNLVFVVLGDSILENLGCLLPKGALRQFRRVDHPYIYGNSETSDAHGDRLRLGFVGSFSFEKGGASFLKLVKELEGHERIEFSVTGEVLYGLNELKERGVGLPQENGLLFVPADEYASRIRQLDYILLLYPADSYKLTASGAVMEAIKWGKPIIAIRNDYFVGLFRRYGAFGYLVGNVQEAVNLILSILSGREKRQFDFAAVRRQSTPECISVQLKQVIEEKTN